MAEVARRNEAPPGDGAGNVEPAQGEQPQPQQGRFNMFFGVVKTLIVRSLIIYFITSMFKKSSNVPPDGVTPVADSIPNVNFFEYGTKFDMYVYLSEDSIKNVIDDNELVWKKTDLEYGDWSSGPNNDGTYTIQKSFIPSTNLQNNGSIYLHVYFIKKTNSNISKNDPYVVHAFKQLNKFKKVKFLKTHNLLTGETSATPEQIEKAEKVETEIISHWHPNLTICLVTDQTNWTKGSLPEPFSEYLEFLPHNRYKPMVFFNDFWNMLRDYQPINKTVNNLDLTLTFQPLSLFKWQMYSAQTMRNKWTAGFLGDTFATDANEDDQDQDSLKEALLETSPYILAATIIVSILHSVFELLAFKNDIQFWKERKSLEGLSVRAVFFNVFQSVIVLLYVLDNDTNTIIRISCFVGLGIECWKINKVLDISIDRQTRYLGIIPKFIFKEKGSYAESSTKEYDRAAFKYLSWVLFPLLAAYAIYSLVYEEHKGWYSWVLNMLYGFLLMFGFITMTPQLFINYKLKSVAHLPWRMMSYKCLNTFIDDIFAFVIKMPTMYRLGCFRDDIVFFIFLYQRWIYRVDPTRVNEFGYAAEPVEEQQQAIEDKVQAVEEKPQVIEKEKPKDDKKND
ncbi:cleft lip and palate transmembrane protein 1 homolog [Myzus persicae]|uniref:cleft lip and palate transmembrane protein 1 homolog n=1 Tax=Myzus persicae TaxID=13164 RepID=UPI000B93322F|nr:cleft lip and palate transmembrane protein 1 homolog [Myzus persicae]